MTLFHGEGKTLVDSNLELVNFLKCNTIRIIYK